MTAGILTKVKFVSKISKMGDNKRIINIPKGFFDQIDNLMGKQLKITIDDEI
jgi:DNA-binding transcriptional regulator GbsR (MarR family)